MQRVYNTSFLSRTCILIAALLVSLVLSLRFGSVGLSSGDVIRTVADMGSGNASLSTIILDIRLPRSIFAAVCGMGLSLSGMALQTITRNDLSDPYVLGVSSGASTGAVSVIVLGWFAFLGSWSVTGAAFLGAALTTALVIFLSSRFSDPSRLVLIGMGISAFFAAVTMLIVYYAPHESQVRSAMFWLMGSLSGIQWEDIPAVLTVFPAAFLLWFFRYDLDVLLLGESEAGHLGMDIKKFRLMVILLSSILVAVLVAKAGVIGFIGLIVPHMARKLAGAEHGKLIIMTSLLGALVMVWADVLARSMAAPSEIPVGVLTSLMGAPLFLHIILRKGKNHD
ncbi:MAG TPA: iron ABC transporter permease [Veillonellaceae bacterium]|nr:iron ABC transporter permease [Veillonellaceae bacterium]